MLDVIGAGATATADRDWHEVWISSKECQEAKEELARIHEDGRKEPPVAATLGSTFANPWFYQARVVVKRSYLAYWRDPTYLMSKISLNIFGGLFIGFTFFKSKNTIQDTQNKLFVSSSLRVGCDSLVDRLAGNLHGDNFERAPWWTASCSVHQGEGGCCPLSFVANTHVQMRNIYEIRERSSRTYHWSALVTSQILVEVPWNILGSSLFFLCWFWTVGFPNDRAGFTYFMYGVLFPIYYTTIALSVASMCPTADIAGLMFSFLFSFVLTL
jgi:ATP-binding cassette subfamily G (WHITE) protein 2 (SNQ2)